MGGQGGRRGPWESELQQQAGPWALAAQRVHQAAPWATETLFLLCLSLHRCNDFYLVPDVASLGAGTFTGTCRTSGPWGQAGLHAADGPHSQAQAQLGRWEQQVLVAVGAGQVAINCGACVPGSAGRGQWPALRRGPCQGGCTHRAPDLCRWCAPARAPEPASPEAPKRWVAGQRAPRPPWASRGWLWSPLCPAAALVWTLPASTLRPRRRRPQWLLPPSPLGPEVEGDCVSPGVRAQGGAAPGGWKPEGRQEEAEQPV